jgi:ketosteroid isomerase-like protein
VVYVKAVWSAMDGRESGKAVRIPFHQVARVKNGRIERTYTSYGTDQLFYDLGFSLYTGPLGVVQHR